MSTETLYQMHKLLYPLIFILLFSCNKTHPNENDVEEENDIQIISTEVSKSEPGRVESKDIDIPMFDLQKLDQAESKVDIDHLNEEQQRFIFEQYSIGYNLAQVASYDKFPSKDQSSNRVEYLATFSNEIILDIAESTGQHVDVVKAVISKGQKESWKAPELPDILE